MSSWLCLRYNNKCKIPYIFGKKNSKSHLEPLPTGCTHFVTVISGMVAQTTGNPRDDPRETCLYRRALYLGGRSDSLYTCITYKATKRYGSVCLAAFLSSILRNIKMKTLKRLSQKANSTNKTWMFMLILVQDINFI